MFGAVGRSPCHPDRLTKVSIETPPFRSASRLMDSRRNSPARSPWISLVVGTHLVAGTLHVAPVSASDHLDGPVTTARRAADLTDLFAYPTPGQPGFLTII